MLTCTFGVNINVTRKNVEVVHMDYNGGKGNIKAIRKILMHVFFSFPQ